MAEFSLSKSGALHVVTAVGDTSMVMLVRTAKEFFTTFIAREAKAQKLKMVVNGSYTSLSNSGKFSVTMGNEPVAANESTPVGQVINEGTLVAGNSSSGKFYFSQNTCGVGQFTAGAGNPPASSCAAIGGVAPIVVNGLPYGVNNMFKAGVPGQVEPTGDVDSAQRPYLIQKSNAMFEALEDRGSEVGKVALGYASAKKCLYVICQADGSTSGSYDANSVRAFLLAKSVDNAVFLDCSDSATLWYDGKFLVSPGQNKNEFLTIAVGFR